MPKRPQYRADQNRLHMIGTIQIKTIFSNKNYLNIRNNFNSIFTKHKKNDPRT